MSNTAQSILKLRRYGASIDLRASMAAVSNATGKGAVRQTAEALTAMLGRQKMSVEEYYHYGLWRPQLSLDERRAFLSEAASTELNLRLSPVDRTSLSGMTNNKLLSGLALRAAGLPMQTPRALYGVGANVAHCERLNTPADLADWLRRDGNLPVFGKPLDATLCIGVASYLALEDRGKSVRLGDGRTVDVDTMVLEIARSFPRGYLFEPIITQHPDVETITGPAVGALRIVTLREPDAVRVLYVAQRLPAVGSMHEGATLSNPFSEALVDGETGRYLRVQNMDQMPPDGQSKSHVTGKPFADVVLPFIKEAQDVALEAHRLLSKPGLLGFDIALAKSGPIINEVNSNPFHSIYQRSGDRGLMNPELKPRIQAALSLARRP